MLRLTLAFFKGLLGPGTFKQKVFEVYFFLAINFPVLISLLFCSYLRNHYNKAGFKSLCVDTVLVLVVVIFYSWFKIQNAKRMAENRGVNYFNLDYDIIKNRDNWLNYLPRPLKYFMNIIFKIWDKSGYYLEKLKRPFRAIKNFFKIWK